MLDLVSGCKGLDPHTHGSRTLRETFAIFDMTNRRAVHYARATLTRRSACWLLCLRTCTLQHWAVESCGNYAISWTQNRLVLKAGQSQNKAFSDSLSNFSNNQSTGMFTCFPSLFRPVPMRAFTCGKMLPCAQGLRAYVGMKSSSGSRPCLTLFFLCSRHFAAFFGMKTSSTGSRLSTESCLPLLILCSRHLSGAASNFSPAQSAISVLESIEKELCKMAALNSHHTEKIAFQIAYTKHF